MDSRFAPVHGRNEGLWDSGTLSMAESGWYHGACYSLRPCAGRDGGFFVLQSAEHAFQLCVLGSGDILNVPRWYALRCFLPAALLESILSTLHREKREVTP